MSWKPEVRTDSTNQWYGNGLRFATREEAESNVSDLMGRWFLVQDTRVAESDEPANYRYVDHELLPVEAAAESA